MNFRPPKTEELNTNSGTSALKVIPTNEKQKRASFLPTVSVINARSLWPKIKSFAAHMEESKSHVAIISEIWGKSSKKELNEITKLLEMEGIHVLFDIRSDKRGGGTAVATCIKHFAMTKIGIPKQIGLEVTAVLIKNKDKNEMCVPIIIFAVY